MIAVSLTPYLIRRFGPGAYGTWVLLSVVMIQGRGLGSLLDLGLQQSMIERIASAPDEGEQRARLGAGILALGLVGIAACVFLATCSPAIASWFRIPAELTGRTVTTLRLLGLQLGIELPLVGITAGLEGLRLYELASSIDAARITVFAAIAIGFAVVRPDIRMLGVASLSSTGVAAVAYLVFARKRGLRPGRGGSAFGEVRLALPLLALRLTGVGYRQLDKIVLSALVGTVATAGFDVAEKVNLAALTALGVATSALIPATASRLRTNPQETTRLALSATAWSAWLTMPLAGLAFGLATPLARVVAGQHIAGTAAAIRWLTGSTAIAVAYAAMFEMAIGAAATVRLAKYSLIGFAINVVATIVLVNIYGLPGSAAASFFATIAVAPGVVTTVARVFGHNGRDLVRSVLPAWSCGILTAAVAWACAFHRGAVSALLLGGATGGAVAVALLGAKVFRFARDRRASIQRTVGEA